MCFIVLRVVCVVVVVELLSYETRPMELKYCLYYD